MKKILALLLVAALALSLAACGAAEEPDPNSGVYEARSASYGGLSIDINTVFEEGFSLELKNGGKAVFHYGGKDYSMKWTLEGAAFQAKGGGAELAGSLVDGVMILEDVLDSGVTLTLVRDAATAPVIPEPETAETAGGPENEAPEAAAEPVLTAWAQFPALTAEETMAMSSWMNFRLCLVEDEVLYGRFFRASERQADVMRLELEEHNGVLRSGAWQVLDEGHSCYWLTKRGDTLYYIQLASGETRGPVARVNTDGSGLRLLAEGQNGFLNMVGDRLYFTDPDHRLVSTDLDGGDRQTVIDREIYYAFFITEDWLIFQDDADNESLHLLYLPEQIDIKLNDERSYAPVIAGRILFYNTPALADGSSCLARIDLSAWESETDPETGLQVPRFTVEHGDKPVGEFLCSGETIWPGNDWAAVSLDDWRAAEDDYGHGATYYLRYVDGKYLLRDYCRDSSSGVRHIYIDNLATGVRSDLGWVF